MSDTSFRRRWNWIPRPVRIVLVAMIGGTVLLLGLAMVVLPGPALLVIPLGLAILALEFAFARRWLKKIKRTANGVHQRIRVHLRHRYLRIQSQPHR